jgi:hypothetical protein
MPTASPWGPKSSEGSWPPWSPMVHDAAGRTSVPDRHLQGGHDEFGPQVRRHRPADDAATAPSATHPQLQDRVGGRHRGDRGDERAGWWARWRWYRRAERARGPAWPADPAAWGTRAAAADDRRSVRPRASPARCASGPQPVPLRVDARAPVRAAAGLMARPDALGDARIRWRAATVHACARPRSRSGRHRACGTG